MLIRFLLVMCSTVFLFACSQEGDTPESKVNEGAINTADGVADKVEVVAGDPEKGQRFYIFCQACHTLNAGGMNKVGPNLHGIFGSPAAAVEGFIYSEALTNSGITWDAQTLDKWVARPTELVPGTTMVFAGINDPQQRADLIAYLEQASAD